MAARLLIAALLMVLSLTSISQCLCGKIRFELKTPDLETQNDTINYTLTVTKTNMREHYRHFQGEQKLLKNDVTEGAINLYFRTGAGIDTLSFILKNTKTNEEMIVTTTHLGYDIPYHIDLLQFKKGAYFFDWAEISSCIEQSKDKKFIECEHRKFSLIYTGKTSFHPWSVKPVDLKYFTR